MVALPKFQSPFVWERVYTQSLDSEEAADLVEGKFGSETPPPYFMRKRTWNTWAFPWILSTVTLAGVCVFLAACLNSGNAAKAACGGQAKTDGKLGSYETGFVTDLKPMTEAIELYRRKFWGGKKTYDNGTWYSNWNPDEPRYVGKPTDEMDQAWRKRIGPFVSLTPSEAAVIPDARPFHGEYPATTTVQHSLHCLNFMRQSIYGENFYPDVINPPPGTASFWPHVEHCVETVRQVLECNADMTPLPMRWDEGAGMLLVDFERDHTCRNYDALLTWAENRYAEDVIRMGGF
ncbi:hypothetical protein F5X97DRAFT_340080 [Nemania serpens]|nr:hypothetical protein F5X97DRAFT_340080 [Nemania serpens]